MIELESSADTHAKQLLHETTKRCNNRFETGLLWADDNVHLPTSRMMALNRLKGVEQKIRKDLNIAELYSKNITHYLEKGYARKLSPTEAAVETPRTWYLPNFGVTTVNKPKKVQLVFDAAATVNGVLSTEFGFVNRSR